MAELRVLIGSANAKVGMAAGIAMLRAGAHSLDAAAAVVRQVEDDADDHSAGYGGSPTLLGDVELDASIIEGAPRRSGAVAALTGFRHPIAVARSVMDDLPHVMLAGSGAARFAEERGAE